MIRHTVQTQSCQSMGGHTQHNLCDKPTVQSPHSSYTWLNQVAYQDTLTADASAEREGPKPNRPMCSQYAVWHHEWSGELGRPTECQAFSHHNEWFVNISIQPNRTNKIDVMMMMMMMMTRTHILLHQQILMITHHWNQVVQCHLKKTWQNIIDRQIIMTIPIGTRQMSIRIE